MDTLVSGDVGLLVDLQGCLHLYVNGVDYGEAARDVPSQCYAVVDLYGQCDQVCGATQKI